MTIVKTMYLLMYAIPVMLLEVYKKIYKIYYYYIIFYLIS